MHLFLTSSPCDDNVPAGVNIPCIWTEQNGFCAALRRLLKPGLHGLIIPADPVAHELNDEMTDTFRKCFEYCGLSPASFVIADDRRLADLPQLIRKSDVIIIGGGHVPTQNAYFDRIGLRSLLTGWSGVLFGISAGSMNCALSVYAMPEEPGEAVDPAYRLFIPGLGLTGINIIPHLNRLSEQTLDGMNLITGIAFRDSMNRTFYAIPDGSYIYQSESTPPTVYGEAYRIRDGIMTKICENERHIRL